MLLAVEGGFISSSVSGYTKGIAFLLFGIGGEGGRSKRSSGEEEGRRPLPWTHNQYQLVNHRRHCGQVQQQTRCIKEEERGDGEEEEEVEEDDETVQLELANSNCIKNQEQAGVVQRRGGRHFLCFGCPTSSSDDFDAHEHDPSARAVNSNGAGDGGVAIGVDEMGRKVFLKSSMKKPLPSSMAVSACDVDVRKGDWDNGSSAVEIAGGGGGGLGVRRKVQWTDGSGMDLTEVKEFEPSEVDESGDEGEGESDRSCGCIIQ